MAKKSRAVGPQVHSVPLGLVIGPEHLYSALCENSENAFLLESSGSAEKNARYSFVGFSPQKIITLREGVVDIDGEEVEAERPIEELKKLVPTGRGAAGQGHNVAGFVGGAVGYFSFDYVRCVEKFAAHPKDETGFPDFEFGLFDDVIAFDHATGKAAYLYGKENRLSEIKKSVRDSTEGNGCFVESLHGGGKNGGGKLIIKNISVSDTEQEFCSKVETAKEHIRAGDIFQAVLSKRYMLYFEGALHNFYDRLKQSNPSPYMYSMKFGARQIIGSSPENLFKVEGDEISSYATLAGTRPRGKTEQEDAALEGELLADKKERAEHLMLVDLTRNDVGKVAVSGSVSVPEFMAVHKYSHVQHIASLVTGKMRVDRDAFDVFNAIFPAGTVSGAPKIRAIDIIDSLENTRRGPYAGAVGYFSANGNADFAIGIRSLFANGNTAFIQTGAGIVYDSVPEKEFLETENKARALLDNFKTEGG